MFWALNQITAPNLSYPDFLDLSAALGCGGVEVRNDLQRQLFDGISPSEAGTMAHDRGLRIVGLSQVYPFNFWSEDINSKVQDLIAIAKDAGAETISLIPRNEGIGTEERERKDNLNRSLTAILPLLEEADLVALVEPLGFQRSSLRYKAELVDAINALGAAHRYKLVHDTFHHALADGGSVFPTHTGIVHISAVIDPALRLDQMEDEHRVLVDSRDRLDNIGQIRALQAAGYVGPVSYECFSPLVHSLDRPREAIKSSLDFIEAALKAK
ncbi:TIM barrel protein [Rhizobium miluonense]|uniref:2-keto-myo-inositol isomerase n=1 Tax=Rhizobium miluonense TaxID=411945 RepID=A0A1C3V5M9_9HYPH|nr:TIM barrel protein [Rhizobium miluonense]SCB22949.1 2-keto-myo-inositol isomerase [Rhizobium miluonense]